MCAACAHCSYARGACCHMQWMHPLRGCADDDAIHGCSVAVAVIMLDIDGRGAWTTEQRSGIESATNARAMAYRAQRDRELGRRVVRRRMRMVL